MRTAPKPTLRRLVAVVEEQIVLACENYPYIAIQDLRQIVSLAVTQGIELQRETMFEFFSEPDTVKIKLPPK